MSTAPVFTILLVSEPSTLSSAVAPGSVKVSPTVSASAAAPFRVTTGAVVSVEACVVVAVLAGTLTVPSGFPTITERRAVELLPALSVAL